MICRLKVEFPKEKPGGTVPPGGLWGFFPDNGGQAFFQINLLDHGHDAAVQEPLFIGIILTHGIQGIFYLKGIQEQIFQFGGEIVVSLGKIVGILLYPDEIGQGVQRQDTFCHSDEKQLGDLIPAVLLFDGIGDQMLFHIVGNHGGR